jgi:hypothetical protein
MGALFIYITIRKADAEFSAVSYLMSEKKGGML